MCCIYLIAFPLLGFNLLCSCCFSCALAAFVCNSNIVKERTDKCLNACSTGVLPYIAGLLMESLVKSQDKSQLFAGVI